MSEEIKVHCAHTHMRKVDDLRAHPNNPNRHPPEQIKLLAQIIKRNGWRNPIVVSKLSGFIIKGHARFEAAQLLGLVHVPVDEQTYKNVAAESADLVADNKIAELAAMDWDVIKSLADELGQEFDPILFGLGENFKFELPETVQPDVGDSMQQYIVSVHCTDEGQMKDLFEELKERDFECRMIT